MKLLFQLPSYWRSSDDGKSKRKAFLHSRNLRLWALTIRPTTSLFFFPLFLFSVYFHLSSVFILSFFIFCRNFQSYFIFLSSCLPFFLRSLSLFQTGVMWTVPHSMCHGCRRGAYLGWERVWTGDLERGSLQSPSRYHSFRRVSCAISPISQGSWHFEGRGSVLWWYINLIVGSWFLIFSSRQYLWKWSSPLSQKDTVPYPGIGWWVSPISRGFDRRTLATW